MTLYQEAQKELKRIQRRISAIEKRGYSFTNLPFKYRGVTRYGEKKTKWSRKEVESLRSTKAKDLYKFATYHQKYIDNEGKVIERNIKGTSARQIEREKAAQKAAITRIANRSTSGNIRKRNLGEVPKGNARDLSTQQKGLKDIRNRTDILSRTQSMVSTIIINTFLDKSKFNNSIKANEVYPKTVAKINELIDKYGKDKVADAIQQAGKTGLMQDIQNAYNDEIDEALERLEEMFGEDWRFDTSDGHIDEAEQRLEDNPFNAYLV